MLNKNIFEMQEDLLRNQKMQISKNNSDELVHPADMSISILKTLMVETWIFYGVIFSFLLSLGQIYINP